MSGVNKVIIIGHLGQDPDVKKLNDGSSVVTLSVATSESWKDKQTGEKKQQTEWHRVVAFNKLADICAQYLSKGSKVYFEGKLQTKKWQDKNGVDRYTTQIQANSMQMLDTKGGSSDRQYEPPMEAYAEASGRDPKARKTDDYDDGIPF